MPSYVYRGYNQAGEDKAGRVTADSVEAATAKLTSQGIIVSSLDLALNERSSAHVTPVQEVVVINFDMKFGTMVWFMVKWAVAAIPALLILAAIYAIIFKAMDSL